MIPFIAFLIFFAIVYPPVVKAVFVLIALGLVWGAIVLVWEGLKLVGQGIRAMLPSCLFKPIGPSGDDPVQLWEWVVVVTFAITFGAAMTYLWWIS